MTFITFSKSMAKSRQSGSSEILFSCFFIGFQKSSFFKLSSCYVQFTSQDAVDDAIEENGRMMHDSPIQVAPKTMSPENVKFRSFLGFHFFFVF